MKKLGAAGSKTAFGCCYLWEVYMTNELKPCPFCGGEATLSQDAFEETDGFNEWAVSCENVPCRDRIGVSSWGYASQSAAIEAWNTRYWRTCTREIIDGTSIRYSVCSECKSMMDVSDAFCRRCGAEVVDD